jgi:trimethylamine--corrinoid protein Co-methyltransferase
VKEGMRSPGVNPATKEELRRLHEAGLQLLEDCGILCESEAVLEICRTGGGITERGSRVVRFRRGLVEEALSRTPRSFVMPGIDPHMDLLVKPGLVYFGMGGSSEPFFYDHGLGRARKPSRSDMETCTRVGEQLPNMDFIMTLCTSGDVPVGQAFYHDIAVILKNTTKPVVFTMLGRQFTRSLIEMASAVAGDASRFRQRPFLMAFVTPVSPLIFPRIAEGVIDAVEAGLPILYSPGPMMGGTAPATLAGLLAQTVAEALFGIVLVHLIRPGAPIVLKMDADVMDPTTGQCTYGSPDQILGRSILAALGLQYQVPTFTMGGGVEAKLPDSEAAAEAMMGMMMNALSGITMSQAQGTMASGLYGSVEQLVICDEMIRMIRHLLSGFRLDEETLALDVIRKVGHGGNFLTEDHTLEHFRKEMYFPGLFRRQSVDDWLNGGARPMVEVAHDRVKEILDREPPVKLPDERQRALEAALGKALEASEREA